MHVFEGDTFYLVEQRARFATTLGGYTVNTRTLQLVNSDNEDVPNYFAAGEIAGGANGHYSMRLGKNFWLNTKSRMANHYWFVIRLFVYT